MFGWQGRILRVNLSKDKHFVQKYDEEFALKFFGGRGFAAKILWDELEPGINPLSPLNKLIIAAGPITGLPGPNTGKLVIAAKSPLTGGYGDGNIGTLAANHMRKAGYDAVVIEGKANKPTYLYIEDDKVELFKADHLWGLSSFDAERKLREVHGKNIGVLLIGPAGENLVRFATIVSQEGRSGGRPGMGAVMGSKKLKAIVFKGSKEIPLADPKEFKKVSGESLLNIRKKPAYNFWMRQGTLMVLEWCQENSVLPTYNFREGVFDNYRMIDGYAMEAMKVDQRGCPNCVMICGNVVIDYTRKDSELDYENVAMLGSNIGLGHMGKVSVLNRLADEYGMDTISLGNVIGFAMEASEKKLIDEKIEWGDYKKVLQLIEDIAFRRGIGNILADGVKSASQKIKGGSERWAMHVKGLEISAYDCHVAPGMALAYGTSPIGAHHKDAWVISWEMKIGKGTYDESKVDKVIEFQRIRGGLFEALVACRFPWIELGFDLTWYPRLLKPITGISFTLEQLLELGDRFYALIRAFWVREFKGDWGRHMDYPPHRWFDEPLTKGPSAGSKLDREGYNKMLSIYYEKRGWDDRGIPRISTLKKLGLSDIINQLGHYVKLRP